ncbi:family 43 glycosylhydrolase [Rhizomicrobium electricum]|uniref:family 43 glycosylhydrolase n=1 Tax=Rhizomicrobium electricum TaxID=480070 RepID=UPI00141F4BF7|nr:family 43 glycosylhydrolase [Rhizomicrobium electricum]
MEPTTRRNALKATLVGAAATVLPTADAAPKGKAAPITNPQWASGVEGQRKADLGNGSYRNPIVPGDHPDPTVLKDGDDYYMTFSSFQAYPGVVIWHSKDLVNWTPIGPALKKPIGAVWATDIAKHNGRYYIYIPAVTDAGNAIYVIHADNIRGPWSDPIDLKISDCIDPGHAVGEDGKRYLFLNGVRRIRLTDDGLTTDGPLEQVYKPWEYPKDWVVEMFAPEGPKILRRGEWFYMIAAVGGTSGPPTSHMVTVARSKSIHGPWENCPHNPIVHTQSTDEPWWSRGHATIVEGPGGDWWMIYHGYENGYRTLGRQPLLEPIEWTKDGWPRAKGGILATPLAKPKGGRTSTAGFALSDDFSTNKLGMQWGFYAPAADETERARYENGSLIVRAKGSSPADCSPLTCVVGDHSYEATVTLEMTEGAQGGLALFYDHRGFVGIGFGDGKMFTYNNGQEQAWMRQPLAANPVRIKVTNRENIVTFHYSIDGKTWIQHPWQMEVSGYHHNVFNGFMSLRIALFSAGKGEVRTRDFTYRGLGG